jgi:hypothetical protein
MHRGFIGCLSDLHLNNEAINLTRYINSTATNITPKSGPCTDTFVSKRECSCEHDGECRVNHGGSWSCDCSKTGYTGRRCEHPTYHIDFSRISTLELNTNMQWSELVNDISFALKVTILLAFTCSLLFVVIRSLLSSLFFFFFVISRLEMIMNISFDFVHAVWNCHVIQLISQFVMAYYKSNFFFIIKQHILSVNIHSYWIITGIMYIYIELIRNYCYILTIILLNNACR